MPECSICVEEYSENSFSCINCGFCCCTTCQVTFMKSFTCMNCKCSINLSQFSTDEKSIIKDNISNTLFDNNKKYDLEVKKILHMNVIKEKIKNEYIEFSKLNLSIYHQVYDESSLHLTKLMNERMKEINISQIGKCDCDLFNFNDGKLIVCECGIIKCSSCKSTIDDDQHECDSSELESLEHIKKNSVNCPSCQVPIHKYEGCYQVMCTECFTIFDYNTGKIDHGSIHAYSFFDILRNYEKSITGGKYISIFNVIKELLDSDHPNRSYLVNTLEFTTNNIAAIIKRDLNDKTSGIKLREDFIVNNIPESEFKDKLYNNEMHKIDRLSCAEQLVKIKYEIFQDIDSGDQSFKYYTKRIVGVFGLSYIDVV